MASQLEAFPPGNFIASDANGTYSVENVVIGSGAGIVPAGRVLGKVTAGGKYRGYRADNTPVGVGTVTGINYAEIDATSVDVVAVMVTRVAEVVTARVTTEVGADKATAVTALNAIGILCR